MKQTCANDLLVAHTIPVFRHAISVVNRCGCCWQTNVDMWEVLVGHMEQMMKHMKSMGPGMMHEHGMGGPPSSPPVEEKPE